MLRQLFLFFILSFFLVACVSVSKFSRGRVTCKSEEVHRLSYENIDGLIVIQVAVNGHQGRFLFDNGFSLCALDANFAQKIGVDFNKQGTLNDAHNQKIKLQEAKIGRISIGPYCLTNSFANQLETDAFLPCDSIDGVIGATFINQLNWKFDFQNKQAWISAKSFDNEGLEFPFKISNNNISHTYLHIANKPIKAMIDFGYQGHIQVRKKELLQELKGEKAEVRAGIHSLSVSGLGNIDTNYIFSNIPVENDLGELLPTAKLTLKNNFHKSAVIGMRYFESYSLTIDNKNHTYWLQAIEKAKQKTPPNNYNASLYMINGKVYILQMNVNDAIVEEVSLFQEVINIDGKKSSYFENICTLKTYLKEKRKQNQKVTIQLKGSDKTLFLSAQNVVKQRL